LWIATDEKSDEIAENFGADVALIVSVRPLCVSAEKDTDDN